ncbi:MAG: hypothetical protein HON90_16270 [Halobacteriovoraceae bacterium]|nr:hypothetical protein [Halobacteriovoraceae bacterium]
MLKLLKLEFRNWLKYVYQALKRDKYTEFIHYLIVDDKKLTVPVYKFYGQIIESLQGHQRKYGIDIKLAIRQIRLAAQKDKKQSKRVQEIMLGLVFQYVVIALFTWFFIFNMQVTIGVKISMHYLIGLALLQCWGLVLGIFVYFKLQRKLFYPYNSYFFSAYIFQSFFSLSLPISEIIRVSKLSSLTKKGGFGVVHKRFILLIEAIKRKGQIENDEFEMIIQELWDMFEQSYQRFNKFLTILKFVLLLFFVFPGFLFAIFLSMTQVV